MGADQGQGDGRRGAVGNRVVLLRIDQFSQSSPWVILDAMAISKPNQFSLPTLMLLTLFVAVLCFLGLYMDWVVPAVIGWTVMIGGTAGRIVAGTRLGFVQGVVFAVLFLLWAGFASLLLPFLEDAPWRMGVTLGLAVLIGGMSLRDKSVCDTILGGYTVRPRPR